MTHNCPYHADVLARWRDLANCAQGIVPAKMPLCPEADDVEMIRDDLNVLARKVDALVASYGEYLAASTGHNVDQRLFKNQLADALEGNALHEVEEAEDYLREEEESARSDFDEHSTLNKAGV